MNRRLHEITGDMLALESLMLEAGGEITPEAEALMTEMHQSLEEKCAGYAAIIRQQDAEQAMWAAEAERCTLHARTAANVSKRLKDWLNEQLGVMGIDKVDAGLFKVARQQNPRSVELLVSVELLPANYRREIPASVEPDKKSMAAAMKADNLCILAVDGRVIAQLAAPTFSLRIR